MSNSLKSKFLIGVMIAASMVAAVGAIAPSTAAAASCSITTTLRVGSKGSQVVCLQTALDHGLVGDGSFGPKTKAAVMAWQASVGLTADGVFGPMSRAAFTNGTSMTYPTGCTSATGFSSTTGQPCSGGTVVTSLPAGCTSTAGFSPVTGASCATGAVTTSGPIAASLASDNPASGYIIDNQATADLAHFNFSGSGTITSITLTRTGISNQNTLDNVYLFQGNTRLTDGYSFNNSGTLVINSLNIAVNGSTTISVKADVDATAAANASTLGVSLTGYTAGVTPVVTNLMGNQMYLGTGQPAGVNFATNAQTVANANVNAGTSSYTVWSSPLQINTRAVWLKGANFRLTGSAPANALANIHLFVDGVDAGQVATMTTITGSNYASFDFSANPISLTTGSHTIDVRADIVGGANYTVTVSLQQAADLVIFDPQVGVNVAATTNSTSFSANTAGIITINPGSAAVVIDPTFQTQTNVTGGATNIAIGRFKVTGYGEDVKVTSLDVLPKVANGAATNCTTDGAGAPTGTCGLNNLTVYFNGSQVGSSYNWTSGSGAHTFQLGSQMIIPAGSISTIEIRADLQTTGNANYTAGTVTAQLNGGTTNAQGQSSHNTVGFPAANVATSGLTIQNGLLAVSKNTGYAAQNVNPNTAGVQIGSFTLQNQSSSEAVRVTSFTVGLTQANGTSPLTSTTCENNVPTGCGAGVTAPALTNFSNLRTSETSGSGSTPIQPTASNTFSVNFTLAPGATDVVNIFADTSADATDVFASTLKVTAIGASSNVSIAQNGDGTAVIGQVISLATGQITNPPTLLTSTSTASQYVAAANGGASNVAKATFNIAATNGSATISEMKFTVNSEDVSTPVSAGVVTGLGDVAMTNTAASFAVGDFVKVSGGSITTPAYGIVASAPTGNMHINFVIVGVGTVSAGSTIAVVPNTVTSVTVNGVSAPVVAGVAYLTGLNISVPNGAGGLNQDVFVSYAPVGTNGVMSGATSRIALESIKYTSGGTTTTMCTTLIGTCTPNIATAIAAPTMTLVGSSPTFTATKPTATLSASNVEAIDVTVTANAKGNVQLNTIKLNYSANGACLDGATNGTPTCASGTMSTSTSNVTVNDANNQVVQTSNTAFAANGTDYTHAQSGSVTITFTNGYTISGSQTFKIFLPVSTVFGTGVNGASLTTSLATGTAAMSWTDLAGNATVAQGIATMTVSQALPTTLIPSYPSTFSSLIYN